MKKLICVRWKKWRCKIEIKLEEFIWTTLRMHMNLCFGFGCGCRCIVIIFTRITQCPIFRMTSSLTISRWFTNSINGLHFHICLIVIAHEIQFTPIILPEPNQRTANQCGSVVNTLREMTWSIADAAVK